MAGVSQQAVQGEIIQNCAKTTTKKIGREKSIMQLPTELLFGDANAKVFPLLMT
jgi:hypothetical protein